MNVGSGAPVSSNAEVTCTSIGLHPRAAYSTAHITTCLSRAPSAIKMQTTDTGLLFQTSQQLADASNRERKIEAAQNIGNPLKLSSKILDLVVAGDDAWTAESGWQARCVDLTVSSAMYCRSRAHSLQSGKTKRLYKGHNGPVTSVCLHTVESAEGAPWLALLTASWDKTVRVWDAKVRSHSA